MSDREAIRVAVLGAGLPTDEESSIAAAVGRGLAEGGALVVCGGLEGVMEAAARGAREAGGRTLGILPGSRFSEANPYIDIAVPTSLGQGRNLVNVLSAHAAIAIGGEWGTLSEIALAVKTGRPVVLLKSWSIAREGVDMTGWIERAESAEEAVRRALALARSARERL